jgi:hypothetical protein
MLGLLRSAWRENAHSPDFKCHPFGCTKARMPNFERVLPMPECPRPARGKCWLTRSQQFRAHPTFALDHCEHSLGKSASWNICSMARPAREANQDGL